jgi:hypothetical protein
MAAIDAALRGTAGFLHRRIDFVEARRPAGPVAPAPTPPNRPGGMQAPVPVPVPVPASAVPLADPGAPLAAPQRVLCPPETVRPLLQWRVARPVGPGLQNLGNTCFLNSVLQCLTYTPALHQYLLSHDHSRQCTRAHAPIARQQRVLTAAPYRPPDVVLPHVRAGGPRGAVRGAHCRTGHRPDQDCRQTQPCGTARAFVFSFFWPLTAPTLPIDIAKHLRFGRQEDAHECTRYFVDGLLKSCLQHVDVYVRARARGPTHRGADSLVPLGHGAARQQGAGRTVAGDDAGAPHLWRVPAEPGGVHALPPCIQYVRRVSGPVHRHRPRPQHRARTRRLCPARAPRRRQPLSVHTVRTYTEREARIAHG